MVSKRYCDVQRNVLQLLLQAGAMTEAELTRVVVLCVQSHKDEARDHKLKIPPTESAQQEFMRDIVLNDISPELERLGMKVAMKKHGGVPYFGLVNLREDELGVASDLGKPQREFFHLLVSAICNQDSKSLDASDACNMRLEMANSKLSISEADECLAQLCSGGWISKSDDEAYTLGIRSELQLMYLTQRSAATEEL